MKELAVYVQDTITKGNWSFNLGIRGDFYNGMPPAKPSGAAAWELRTTLSRRTRCCGFPTRGYCETPFNENLVLASEGCNDPVVNALMARCKAIPASLLR